MIRLGFPPTNNQQPTTTKHIKSVQLPLPWIVSTILPTSSTFYIGQPLQVLYYLSFIAITLQPEYPRTRNKCE
jgi:hypothetical protein